MTDARVYVHNTYNTILLLYSQNPSMTTAAAASHTYRTVTLTRYTLNYATLPDDPQLCRGPRSGKKNFFQNHHHHSLLYYHYDYFFSPSGAIRVGLCCTCIYAQMHRIIYNNTASNYYYNI
jgi:hypothetical protein